LSRIVIDEKIPYKEFRKDIEKVRAIVELEKPAHTLLYLKLTPVDDAD
jgi:hypothetical protein